MLSQKKTFGTKNRSSFLYHNLIVSLSKIILGLVNGYKEYSMRNGGKVKSISYLCISFDDFEVTRNKFIRFREMKISIRNDISQLL